MVDICHQQHLKCVKKQEEIEKKKEIVNRTLTLKINTDGKIDKIVNKIQNPLVGVSEFVKRQISDSTFTHFQNSWAVLMEIIIVQMSEGNYDYGYRNGVILVHMTERWSQEFYTFDSYRMFEGMKLNAKWAKTPGREHEPATLQVKILEPKFACNYVDIVLYRKDVLEEDKEDTTGSDWDIISINGRLKKDAPPIDPMTLVRNWLHLPGGTKMKDTTPDKMLKMLCDSILYKNGMKEYVLDK